MIYTWLFLRETKIYKHTRFATLKMALPILSWCIPECLNAAFMLTLGRACRPRTDGLRSRGLQVISKETDDLTMERL